jgi:cytidyltransferase-like protein
MKKVLVFGTFDIFHEGHKNLLRQAREYGGFLGVVIARDATVAEVKHIAPQNDEQMRKQEIIRSGLADEVMLGDFEDKYKVVKEFAPDVICLGYDQKFFIETLEEKLKSFGLEKTKIIRLEAFKPEIYKSSKLRNKK